MLSRFPCGGGVDGELRPGVAARATSQPLVRYVRESRQWSVNTLKVRLGSVLANYHMTSGRPLSV
jgi:hypothetical protein